MTKPKKPIILPRKMSKLIRIALRDLEKAEKSRSYIVDMGTWHLPVDNKCYVCLAGSAMAFSLNVKKNEFHTPSDLAGNAEQLSAIDWLREGDVSFAAGDLDLRVTNKMRKMNRSVAQYYEDPKQFKRDMRKLARDLAAEGL